MPWDGHDYVFLENIKSQNVQNLACHTSRKYFEHIASLCSKQFQGQIPNLIYSTNPIKNGTDVYSSTVLLCNMHWTDSAQNLRRNRIQHF